MGREEDDEGVEGPSYLLRLHVSGGEVLHTVHEAVLRQLVVRSQELLELFNTQVHVILQPYREFGTDRSGWEPSPV